MLVDGGGFHDNSFDIGRMCWHPVVAYRYRQAGSGDTLSRSPGSRQRLAVHPLHFKVGTYWESGIRDSSGSLAGNDLGAIAARRAIPVKHLTEILGEHTIGACRLRIRHPSSDYLRTRWDGKDLNNACLVIEVDHGNAHVVLPGDIDQSVEDLLFVNTVLPGKVLLAAPHHGSQRSTGPTLLDHLRPHAVVFSCGHGKRIRIPTRSSLERVRERSIRFHRTDLEGAVWAVSDGDSWSFPKLTLRDDFS